MIQFVYTWHAQVVFAGQEVTGEFHFTLMEVQSLKCIEIIVSGGSHVKWEEYYSGGRTDVTYSSSRGEASETYLKDTEVLWKSTDSPDGKLGPGIFILPFQIHIPAACPSSFKGKWGDITYIITAKIVKGELIHQDQTIQLPIRVKKLSNPYLPQVNLPTQETRNMEVSSFCCEVGEVQFTAKFPRSGCCLGYNFPLTVDFVNNSKHPANVRAVIMRTTKFIAGPQTKEEERVLAKAQSPDIDPFSEYTWTVDNLVISAKEETAIEGSKIITVEDNLMVTAIVPNWWKPENSLMTFPITVENVPMVDPPTVS